MHIGPTKVLLDIVTNEIRADRDDAHGRGFDRDTKRALAIAVTHLEDAQLRLDSVPAALYYARR